MITSASMEDRCKLAVLMCLVVAPLEALKVLRIEAGWLIVGVIAKLLNFEPLVICGLWFTLLQAASVLVSSWALILFGGDRHYTSPYCSRTTLRLLLFFVLVLVKIKRLYY